MVVVCKIILCNESIATAFESGGQGFESLPIVEAANEADAYRRQRELARHISAKRIATSQSL